VLATRAKDQGSEHPDSLTSLSSLAGTLQKQGKLIEAEAMQQQV